MEGFALSIGDIFRPGMRTYFIPLAAGVVLAVSAFLPWVVVNDVSRAGVPDTPGLWILALGVLAAVLATLSLITRRNSRHPMLVLGLFSLGITVLSSRILPRLAREQAWTVSQAFAIVENTPAANVPEALIGIGLYVGMAASVALVGFGLTIVVRRATPYAISSPDDDV